MKPAPLPPGSGAATCPTPLSPPPATAPPPRHRLPTRTARAQAGPRRPLPDEQAHRCLHGRPRSHAELPGRGAARFPLPPPPDRSRAAPGRRAARKSRPRAPQPLPGDARLVTGAPRRRATAMGSGRPPAPTLPRTAAGAHRDQGRRVALGTRRRKDSAARPEAEVAFPPADGAGREGGRA